MKKRCIAFFLCLVFCALSFTGCAEINGIANEIMIEVESLFDPQNVYEELWNLVVSEKYRKETFLTTVPEGGYTDFDLGQFAGVKIPLSESSLSLDFNSVTSDSGLELYFLFYYTGTNKNISYSYDPESKILYGEEEESYFFDQFLTEYFKWAGKESAYSAEEPGLYRYQYANPIWKRDAADEG